jgi:hypothetical protein
MATDDDSSRAVWLESGALRGVRRGSLAIESLPCFVLAAQVATLAEIVTLARRVQLDLRARARAFDGLPVMSLSAKSALTGMLAGSTRSLVGSRPWWDTSINSWTSPAPSNGQRRRGPCHSMSLFGKQYRFSAAVG